jgi:hypothetical protein
MPRLLYATPTGNHPTVGYVISQRAVEMACRSFGVRHARDFQFFKGPVHQARSAIAAQTVKGICHVDHGTKKCETDRARCQVDPYDFVLMHDDDVTIYPQGGHNPLDEFLAIFDADPTVGVVGALYLRQTPLLVNLTTPHPRHPGELCHVIHGIPNQPFEAGGVATGFMMIRREVFEQLGRELDAEGGGPMFRFGVHTSEWGTRHEFGEDYDFCVRARAAGWKVIADPRWITTHVKERGPLVYDRDAWERRWQNVTPASACLRELQEACPETFRVEKLPNGLVILDHTDQRALEAKQWRERVTGQLACPSPRANAVLVDAPAPVGPPDTTIPIAPPAPYAVSEVTL